MRYKSVSCTSRFQNIGTHIHAPTESPPPLQPRARDTCGPGQTPHPSHTRERACAVPTHPHKHAMPSAPQRRAPIPLALQRRRHAAARGRAGERRGRPRVQRTRVVRIVTLAQLLEGGRGFEPIEAALPAAHAGRGRRAVSTLLRAGGRARLAVKSVRGKAPHAKGSATHAGPWVHARCHEPARTRQAAARATAPTSRCAAEASNDSRVTPEPASTGRSRAAGGRALLNDRLSQHRVQRPRSAVSVARKRRGGAAARGARLGRAPRARARGARHRRTPSLRGAPGPLGAPRRPTMSAPGHPLRRCRAAERPRRAPYYRPL